MHAEASYPVSVTINGAVRERHPDVRVRGFAVSGLLAAAPRLDIPSPEDVAQAAATRFPPGAEVIEDPILRGWREAFRQSGLRPSRYRSSVEALVRRVVRGEDVLTATPVVRLYCALSVIHVSPLGAYDLDRLGPTLDLIAEVDATSRTQSFVLLTRVRAATRSARLTREILADMGVSLLEAQIPLRESLATSFGTIPSGDNPYRVVLDELMTKELAA